MTDKPVAGASNTCAMWQRANAVEVPDVPEMIDHPGDTVSCFVAVSDGFRVGRARWHYPTKSWCHKGSYDGEVLFWSPVPTWDSTAVETVCGPPMFGPILQAGNKLTLYFEDAAAADVGHEFLAKIRHAETPICQKCGQIDLRIPRMGIYHVCPTEKASEHPPCSIANMWQCGSCRSLNPLLSLACQVCKTPRGELNERSTP